MTATGDLEALDEVLQQRHVAVREGVDHRRGQLLGGADDRAAQRRAALGRLHHQRQPQAGDQRRHHLGGTQLAERLVRQAHRRRRLDPGAGDERLGDRLVERRAARGRRRAHVGDRQQLEHLADRPVLAGLAVQHRHDTGGPLGAQRGQQRGVDVPLRDLTIPTHRSSASARRRCFSLTSRLGAAPVAPRPMLAGRLGMARTIAVAAGSLAFRSPIVLPASTETRTVCGPRTAFTWRPPRRAIAA